MKKQRSNHRRPGGGRTGSTRGQGQQVAGGGKGSRGGKGKLPRRAFHRGGMQAWVRLRNVLSARGRQRVPGAARLKPRWRAFPS